MDRANPPWGLWRMPVIRCVNTRESLLESYEMKRKVYMNLLVILFTILLFAVFGCSHPSGLSSDSYSLDDDRLIPFAAMYAVDRELYCLTEIAEDSRVEIEIDSFRSRGYDVMLHIHSDNTYRTVAFVRENNEYVWIGEQEIHYSGYAFVTPDGEIQEHISVTYHDRDYGTITGTTEPVIVYTGENEDIPSVLTCEQAAFYIEEWSTQESNASQ